MINGFPAVAVGVSDRSASRLFVKTRETTKRLASNRYPLSVVDEFVQHGHGPAAATTVTVTYGMGSSSVVFN